MYYFFKREHKRNGDLSAFFFISNTFSELEIVEKYEKKPD